jgi:hexosaminidase
VTKNGICVIVPAPRSFTSRGKDFSTACLEILPQQRFANFIEAFREDAAQLFGEECVSPGSYREERAFAAGIDDAADLWGATFFPESAPITELTIKVEDSVAAGAYSLTCMPSGISIEASEAEGLRAGMASLIQLMLSGWDGWRFTLPSCQIEDRPEYSWRGAMLDSARHFIPVPEIKKLVRTLSLYKINRLHWHLTDDQGWRIQILSHPELTEIGSTRPGNDPHRNGYYSQAEIREIVAYAEKRGMRIIPEIDLPGHARSILACMPGLSCAGGPHSVMTSWGVSEEVLCMGNPDTLRVVKEIWSEVCGMFTAPWVHVGGDECPTKRWESCPRCQEKKRASAYRNEVDLHGWFIAELSAYLRSLGKEVFGWDEVLDSSIDNGAGVYYWRNWLPNAANEALKKGRDLVVAPNYPYYFDFIQKRDRFATPGVAREKHKIVDLETVYRYDPEEGLDRAGTPPENALKRRGRYLGIQANLWTEYIRDEKRLEYMLFPRLLAVAETAWLGKARPGWWNFSRRMGNQLRMLSRMDINACPL